MLTSAQWFVSDSLRVIWLLSDKQLFKVLGLSVILSEKLLRARKSRRLDPTRDTKSVRQLYHHILWLAREGLVIVEQYVLPMVGSYIELRVLAYKLRASFYHIFVLFHNQPSVNKAGGPFALFPEPLSPRGSKLNRDSITRSPPRQRTPNISGGPVGGPPGLPPPPEKASPSAIFLLPAMDYTPAATTCFITANTLAERLLQTLFRPGAKAIDRYRKSCDFNFAHLCFPFKFKLLAVCNR